MIKSMTAFAETARTEGAIQCEVEIRSYNSRHLDVALYLPRPYAGLEEGIRKQVADTVARGRVEIRITVAETREDVERFQVDSHRARGYYQALSALRDQLGTPDPISLDQVLAGGRMIVEAENDRDLEAARKVVSAAVETALAGLDDMRCNEGAHLAADLGRRMDAMAVRMGEVESEAETLPEMARQRLMERVARLTGGGAEIDPVRVAQEVALLADKSDISEEIVRTRSHIRQFREVLAGEAPGGRKLNFLIQEFNREFNTMGAKSGKTTLSHTIVDLKSALEKVREQVQNIE